MRKAKKALLMLVSSLTTAMLMMVWPQGHKTEVEAAVIKRGNLIQTIWLNGVVRYAEEQMYFGFQDGIVSDVYVVPGQIIHEGDLLMKMDTAEAEKMLASLYETKFRQTKALESMEDTAALVFSNDLAWTEQESRLKTMIELSYLRAQADGVMESVYVHKGQAIEASALLGVSRGEGICFVAETSNIKTPNLFPGLAAAAKSGQKEAALILKSISFGADSGKQTLFFETLDKAQMQEFRVGEIVSIELVTDVYSENALIPLSAIDADEMIWIVENGNAYRRQICLEAFNQDYAGVELDWVGKDVILQPDKYALQEGMAVRVIK